MNTIRPREESDRSLPFSVDRDRAVPLVRQVVDGCRSAIATGAFPVGRCLPSLTEMADGLGVSLKVVRTAYGRLREEGWLLPRHGVGYQAKDCGVPVWKGSVLLVYDNNSYSMCACCNALQRRLELDGYLVECVKVGKLREHNTHDLARLKARLFKRYDFAFTFACCEDVADLLVSLKCPLFTLAEKVTQPSRLKAVSLDGSNAYEKLAQTCRAIGVNWIEVVDLHAYPLPIVDFLRHQGFRVNFTPTPFCYREEEFFESIRFGARDMFLRRLAHDRRHLPDLFFFLDDYVFTGALQAFTAVGLRMPEDVRVVVLCNRGDVPCTMKELTRLSIDLDRLGSAVAECILAWMADHRAPLCAKDFIDFIPGETL